MPTACKAPPSSWTTSTARRSRPVSYTHLDVYKRQGVDDFIAEATPETKLAAIRQYQAEGHMVAMTGRCV